MNLKDTAKKKINLIIQLTWPLFFLIISRFHDGQSMAYLAAAMEGYLLLLLLFLYAMPRTMEKLMRSRIAKGQLKNAGMIFKGGTLTAVLFAVVLGCILYGTADIYAKNVLHMPFAALTLKILILFLLTAAFLLPLQGFFQGTGSYMPTFASGIGFAVFMTAGGILFVWLFEGYGQKAAALLQNATVAGMYRSAGTALGIAAAGLIPYVFLLFLYFGTGRRILLQWKKEGLKKTETCSSAGRILLLTSFSAALVFFLNRLPVYLGILFYQMTTKGTAVEPLGGYYSMVEMTGLFFVILFSIGLVRSQNTIVSAVKREEMKIAKENLNAAVQWSLLASLALPAFSMGAGIPILHLLFPRMKEMPVLLTLSGIGVVLFLPAGFFIGIRLALGQKRQVNLSLLSALAVYIVFVLVGLKVTGQNIYVLALGRVLFGAVICGMNGFSLCRTVRFEPEWVRTVLFPIISAGVTGLILFLLQKALYTYLGDVLMLLITLLIGSICYLSLLFVLRCIQKKELRLMPGGQVLEKVGTFLHLL